MILFVVLVLVLTGLAQTLSQSQPETQTPTQKLLYLSVEKPWYELGEKVTLIITTGKLENYELSISSEENFYKFSGELSNNIDFYPKEEGLHTVELTEKTSNNLADSLEFIVGTDTAQTSSEKPLEKISNEIISTDKIEYYPGEPVTIIIRLVEQSSNNFNLYYEYQGFSQKYMGNLSNNTQIVLIPRGLGTHQLILMNKNNNIIDNHSFEIKENPSINTISSPVKIKNSQGGALQASITFYNEEDTPITTTTTQSSYAIPKNTKKVKIIPTDQTVENIVLEGLEGEINLGMEKIHPLKNPVPDRHSISSFAIDPTQTNFTNATVTRTAKGTELWKCKDYTFETQTCFGTWEKVMNITPGESYSFLLTPEDPQFTETITNLFCSCQVTVYSIGGDPDTDSCSTFCSATIDVPAGAQTGYLMNMSYGVSITLTGDVNSITAGSHEGQFDQDQTYGNGNAATIGSSTTTSTTSTTWLNNTLVSSGSDAFDEVSCDDWANTCTWYVYLSSEITVDAGGKSDKTATTNISLTSMSYTWNYTMPGDLTVTLNWPSGNLLNYSSINFNYTPSTTATLQNCTLYTNRTGVFTNESTNSTPQNDQPNYFNQSFSSDGYYLWNVYCEDSDSNMEWAPNNKTFLIDTTEPTINLESPEDENETSAAAITFYYNVSDTYGIKNCSLIIDGEIDQTEPSVTRDTSQSFTTSLANGEHTWAVWCYDLVNNLNKSENRTINVTLARRIWTDRWYETGTANYSGTAADISLENQTDGIQNQLYYNLPSVTPLNFLNATSPYIGGDGAFIGSGATVTFRMAFAAAEAKAEVSWHLYVLHAGGSMTEVCSNGDDRGGGTQVTVITEATCSPSSNIKLSGTDRLKLVINIYNTQTGQLNDVTHYFDHANSYVNIENFVTLGHLQVDLIQPTENLILSQGETYNQTCNVTCIDGTCLNTQTYVQYNTSADPWTNISSSGNIILGASETNPHITGNISSATNETYLINGSQPSTNYVRCYAESQYSSATGTTLRRIIVGDTLPPDVSLTRPADFNYSDSSTVTFFYDVYELTEIANCSIILNGSINDTKYTAEIVNDEENNFTVTGLTESSYNWTVNCTDNGGYTGTDTPRTIYIDLTDPWIFLNYPGQWDTVGYETVNFNWTANDNYNQNLDCDLYIDGAINETGMTSPQATPANQTVTGLSVGNHTWYMNCSDVSGRRNISETRNFTIQDSTPTVKLEFPPPDHVNDSSPLLFQYNASDNNGFLNCTLFIDGQKNETNSSIANNELNNFSILLSEGDHNWTVTCIDTGYLNDTAAWQDFTIDLIDPYVFLNEPIPTENFTNGDVTFNYTAYDSIDLSLSCELFIDGNSESNDTATNSSPELVNINNILDGFHYWNVTCTDDSTRQNISETRNFTINESPHINLNIPAQWNVSNENITFFYTPIDNDGFTNCTIYIDGDPNATNITIYNGVQNNFTIGKIPEGNHTWNVGCVDNGTYLNSNVSLTRNFTVDTTNPTLILNFPGPDEQVNQTQVDFNWTANDTLDTSLSCDLYIGGDLNQSGIPSEAGNQTVISKNFPNGRYNWSIICYDDANNYNTSETLWFNVSTPPSIELTFPDPNENMNYTDLMFEYIPSAGAAIQNCTLYIDGQENETNSSIDPDNYNYFWITLGIEGKHNWSVRCIDVDLIPGWSETRNFTLDFKAPRIEMNYPGDDDTVTRNRIEFNFTAIDDYSLNMTCNLSVDGTPVGLNLPVQNDTPKLYNETYPDGNYTWYVECWDNATNYNITDTWNFTIIAPPDVTLISPANGNFTNATYVNLTYLPEDDYVIPNCSLYLNGTYSGYYDDNVDTNDNNSFDIIGLGEGYYNWTVNCTDQDENTYAPSEWNFTIDQTPPIATLLLPSPGALLTSENVLFNFSVVDSIDDNVSCNLTINGSINISNIPVNNNSYYNNTLQNLNDSLYLWNVTCWDTASNKNTTATQNFTVQAPPKIALGNPEQNNRTTSQNISFFFTPTDNSGSIANCTLILNGDLNETLLIVNESEENNITVNNLPNGTYVWTVNCTDPSGNIGTNSTGKTLYIDLYGPNITLHKPDPENLYNDDDILFNWTATDFTGTSITCNLSVSDPVSSRNASIIALSGSVFNTTLYDLSDGIHYWNVTCWDDLNTNATSETRNFTITQPDLITTTGNITFNNTNPDENTNITINATIFNIGGRDANNAVIDFWDGNPATGTYIGNDTITITAGSNTIASIIWNITSGYHTIWIIIDPSDAITELNETNNNASKNISILKAYFNSPQNQTTTNDTTPEINFTMEDYTGGTINYTIYVDGTPNGQADSGTDNISIAFDLTALSDGSHNITVQATDNLSRSKNSSRLIIIIDTTVPTVNFETRNHTWFNHSNPNVYFNITDSLDNNINYSTYLNTTFQSSGNISNATSTNKTFTSLGDGQYNVTIQATDDVNNSANYTLKIYVDTTKPSINLTSPEENANFTTSSVDLNFTVTDNMASSLNCNLTLDDGFLLNNTGIGNNSPYSTTATNLAEGTHYWNVTCWDNASNTNTSETKSFNIFIPPIVNLTKPADNNISNNPSQTLYFNVSDDTGIENCSLYLNGEWNTTKTPPQITNNAENNFTITLAEAEYNWSIKCYDNTTQQLEANSENWTITIDQTPPTPNITTTNYTWFNTSSPSIDFIITDNVANPINYTFYVNSSSDTTGTSNNNTPNSDTLTITNSNSSFRIILQATDDVGNSANSSSIIIYVDTVKPNINISKPTNDQVFDTNSVQFNFTITDNMADYTMCNLTISNGMTQLNINATNDTLQNITKSGFTSGTYFWNVTCLDLASNKNTSVTWNFTILAPDLVINTGNITFNDSSPEENKNITIYANIFNIGGSPASDVIVQFWNGDPDGGGTKINGNKTISTLNNGANFTVNVTYNVSIGTNNIFVVVDPPTLTNGTIDEENENNNKANNSFGVELYQVYAGNISSIIDLEKQSINISIFQWNISNSTGSNIYVTDLEASPDFTSLQAISRDTSNDSVTDDFEEIDTALSSTSYSDSVNTTFTTNNNPKETQNFIVFTKNITNVPIINSTNTTNFKTGILWDKSDGHTEYNGTQDIIFITEINEQKQGSRGIYDFEIKVPALLRNYNAAGNSIAFYAEIK